MKTDDRVKRVGKVEGSISALDVGTVIEVDAVGRRARVKWDDLSVPNFYDPVNRPPTIRKGKRTWVGFTSLRPAQES